MILWEMALGLDVGVSLAASHLTDHFHGPLIGAVSVFVLQVVVRLGLGQPVDIGGDTVKLDVELDLIAVGPRDEALGVVHLEEGLSALQPLGGVDILHPELGSDGGNGELLIVDMVLGLGVPLGANQVAVDRPVVVEQEGEAVLLVLQVTVVVRDLSSSRVRVVWNLLEVSK